MTDQPAPNADGVDVEALLDADKDELLSVIEKLARDLAEARDLCSGYKTAWLLGVGYVKDARAERNQYREWNDEARILLCRPCDDPEWDKDVIDWLDRVVKGIAND